MAGLERAAARTAVTFDNGSQAAVKAGFAHGMEGDPAFKVIPEAVALRNVEKGYPMDPAFIRFGDDQTRYGVIELKITEEPVEVRSGLFGKKTVMKEVPTYPFRAHPEPALPTTADKVLKRIKQLKSDANTLRDSARGLGAKKAENLEKAETAQAAAQKRMDEAGALIDSGDIDNAKSALYEVVSLTETANRYKGTAEKLAKRQSALFTKVDTFKSGLARVETDTDILVQELEAAKVENRVTREMTDLGSSTDNLSSQIDEIRAELQGLNADTRSLDEMVAQGHADSLLNNPLDDAARKANADTAVEEMLAQLVASRSTTAASQEASGAAVGATKAAEDTAEEGAAMAAGA